MGAIMQITLEDFKDDTPWDSKVEQLQPVVVPDAIADMRLLRLDRHGDKRGHLTVLMSELREPAEKLVHVYQVMAEARSVRAWVYHKRQWDRLAFNTGDFRVVLYDLRPGSATYGKLNVLDVGDAAPSLLFIPPFIIHGVQNKSDAPATFVNMPTRAYDPAFPDKSRLPANHPGIPYQFA